MSYLLSQFISLNLSSSKSIVTTNGDSMPLEVKLVIPDMMSNLLFLIVLYMTGKHMSVDSSSFLLNRSSSAFYLWHSRLVHVSGSRLRFLASTGALEKLDAHDISDCSGCKLAKFSALPFDNSVSSSNAPFDLVHSDVWGPSPIYTKGGSRYYVSFIDDFTRYTWVYLMKRRSVFEDVQAVSSRGFSLWVSPSGSGPGPARYGWHNSGVGFQVRCIVTASGPGFGDWQWRLATLPFVFGGLGVYSTGDVLNYAFLASRLQSAYLQTKLLRHTGIVSPGPNFDDALSVFNTYMETDLLSNPSEIVAPKLIKKMTDIYFTRVTKNIESIFSLSPRQMALWTSQRENHTSDWLRTVPISGLGQTMNGKTYRCVLCYRLGIPLFYGSKPCSRVFAGDIYGDHAVSCAGIVGIKHRHNVVRDTLVDICYRSGISAGKEVDIGLDGGVTNHYVQQICYFTHGLRDLMCVTGSSPLTRTGMVNFVPGRVVIDAAQHKRGKYMDKCAAIGYGFLPFSFSSLGELEADAVTLLKRIRKFSITQDIGAQIVSRLPSNFLFKEENRARPLFNSNLFKQLSSDEVQFLDCNFTNVEIKEAVWEYRSDKAPGPDGFTFKFFKKHWDILENDVFSFVKEFESSSYIPVRCNSSFITLIPKIEDPLLIGDYRPISLIGCQYKFIAKVLANRLSKVLPSVVVVGEAQMAFIKGRQIVDGPLIVNEIIAWAKKHKKRLMFLKVDFEKAFDSLSWPFLFSIMEQVGFSREWIIWIRSCLYSEFAYFLEVHRHQVVSGRVKGRKDRVSLHELYQKKFAESEPYAIEELDKYIYDCQVALSECITKVEVLIKQIKDTEDLKAVVVDSSVETSTVESFVGAFNARDVLYGPTVHALAFRDTAETIEDCDTYLGL
ncbi:RNA-directed DNA polymerase, eukaryota [Tanacetum coccineum]